MFELGLELSTGVVRDATPQISADKSILRTSWNELWRSSFDSPIAKEDTEDRLFGLLRARTILLPLDQALEIYCPGDSWHQAWGESNRLYAAAGRFPGDAGL